jgi:transposase InsO family protein
MSRVGDCWDNAVAESFFATLKKDLIHRRPYNPHRRHSSIGNVSPMEFERLRYAAINDAA